MKLRKSRFIILFSALIFALAPTLVSASTANSEGVFEDYDTQFEEQLYLESLNHNSNFEADLNYSKYLVKMNIYLDENGEEMRLIDRSLTDDGAVTTNGAIGLTLKGLKFVGNVVKHGGNTLAMLLKPYSPSVATAVKNNAAKIGKALAAPQKVTKAYVKQKLRDAGVSKDNADTITWWIFMIL